MNWIRTNDAYLVEYIDLDKVTRLYVDGPSGMGDRYTVVAEFGANDRVIVATQESVSLAHDALRVLLKP